MPTSQEAEGNPTAGCTRHDYSDEEALGRLLAGWQVVRWDRADHQLRAFRMRSGG